MQNKPNFRKAKMNKNLFATKDYENQGRLQTPEKQTQSNPIKPNFKQGTYSLTGPNPNY
jgi:hypothetical protein